MCYHCCPLLNDILLSPFIGYAAPFFSWKVSAYTAAIIAFGDVGEDAASFELTRYTLSRMMQTFLGLSCYIFCTLLIFPTSARDENLEVLDNVFQHLHKQHGSAIDLAKIVSEQMMIPAQSLQSGSELSPSQAQSKSGEENDKKASNTLQAGRPINVAAHFKQRMQQRKATVQTLALHAEFQIQASFEFNCRRADFEPVLLSLIRRHARRVVEIHGLLDLTLRAALQAKAPTPTQGPGSEDADEVGRLTDFKAKKRAFEVKVMFGSNAVFEQLAKVITARIGKAQQLAGSQPSKQLLSRVSFWWMDCRNLSFGACFCCCALFLCFCLPPIDCGIV